MKIELTSDNFEREIVREPELPQLTKIVLVLTVRAHLAGQLCPLSGSDDDLDEINNELEGLKLNGKPMRLVLEAGRFALQEVVLKATGSVTRAAFTEVLAQATRTNRSIEINLKTGESWVYLPEAICSITEAGIEIIVDVPGEPNDIISFDQMDTIGVSGGDERLASPPEEEDSFEFQLFGSEDPIPFEIGGLSPEDFDYFGDWCLTQFQDTPLGFAWRLGIKNKQVDDDGKQVPLCVFFFQPITFDKSKVINQESAISRLREFKTTAAPLIANALAREMGIENIRLVVHEVPQEMMEDLRRFVRGEE